MTVYRGLLLAVLVVFTGACSSGEPAAVTVHGKVTLDGRPLPAGKILFFPPGETPREIEIKDGTYEGPAKPGMNAVQFGVYKPGAVNPTMPEMEPVPVNTLPAKYHSASTYTADVKDGEANEFNFDLTSK